MAVVPAAAAAAAAADGSLHHASPAGTSSDVEFHLEGCPKMRLKRSSSDEIIIVSLSRPSSTSSHSIVLANVSKASFQADTSMRPALTAAGDFPRSLSCLVSCYTHHALLLLNLVDVFVLLICFNSECHRDL
jgi:hypothetical protein